MDHSAGPGDFFNSSISRRHFIELGAAAGVSLVFARHTPVFGRGVARWSNPTTWGGRVPGRNDVAVISKPVLLDVNARVRGVVVRHSGHLIWQRGASRKLTSTGNIVVEGRLDMRPRRAGIVHRIEFVGVDEGRFVGGGHDVLRTDVGLWVMHHGRLEIAGTAKEAWARSTGAVPAGATSIELDRDPLGWTVGDEIVLTPTRDPSGDHHSEFDRSRIASIAGRTVTLESPTSFDRPSVAFDESTYTAEVLNLTRNVIIGGSLGGRTHVFIHSGHPQTIKFATLRHVGPRQDQTPPSKEVLGRYGLHFHHSYDVRGSSVEGVVVRDCGNHSFVPHTSHGVKFRKCIAYDVLESPFWWDEGDRTNDTLWEQCVAAKVDTENLANSGDLSGFFLGKGRGNTVRGCVATGIRGSQTAAGFTWPPEPLNGVWTFEDCLAHNNEHNGGFVWQKNGEPNVVTRFTSYRNGGHGVQHGSFQNSFDFVDGRFVGNGLAQVALHANSHVDGDTGLRFRNMFFDASGGANAVEIKGHLAIPQEPVQFLECRLVGAVSAPILMRETGNFPSLQDFVRCSVDEGLRDLQPTDFQLAPMEEGGKIRVQQQDDSAAYEIDHTGQVTPIPPFAATA